MGFSVVLEFTDFHFMDNCFFQISYFVLYYTEEKYIQFVLFNNSLHPLVILKIEWALYNGKGNLKVKIWEMNALLNI